MNSAVANFVLHPQLAADTAPVGDFPLCRVLLMDDSRYPWFLLVPRVVEDIRELHDLTDAERHKLSDESARLARAMSAQFSPHKLNVAAIGNMVPQLHVHHVARFQGDPAWPATVWGRHPPLRYPTPAKVELVKTMRTALGI